MKNHGFAPKSTQNGSSLIWRRRSLAAGREATAPALETPVRRPERAGGVPASWGCSWVLKRERRSSAFQIFNPIRNPFTQLRERSHQKNQQLFFSQKNPKIQKIKKNENFRFSIFSIFRVLDFFSRFSISLRIFLQKWEKFSSRNFSI